MIVRHITEVHGSARHVTTPTWESHRLLVAGDGLGFSLHDTVIRAGTETEMEYRNHQEAVYCVAGSGSLVDLTSGEQHEVGVGTLYVLDGHERHLLRATTDLHLVCAFTPPCVGDEQHDETGSYPLVSTAADS